MVRSAKSCPLPLPPERKKQATNRRRGDVDAFTDHANRSYLDVQKLNPNAKGQVFHSNHYLVPHEAGVFDTVWLEDSRFRLERIEELCSRLEVEDLCLRSVQSIFTDEKNYPHSICRAERGDNESETLFNIVMDLRARAAKVILGRPTSPEGFFELSF